MTDYQRVLIDSIMEDMGDSIFEEFPNASIDSIGESFRAKLESRIVSYDNERREQYIKALSESLPRLVSEVI